MLPIPKVRRPPLQLANNFLLPAYAEITRNLIAEAHKASAFFVRKRLRSRDPHEANMRHKMTNSMPQRSQNTPKTATSGSPTNDPSRTSDAKAHPTTSRALIDAINGAAELPNPIPSPGPKRIRGDANKRLRRSAMRVVRNNSEAIAAALLNFTLAGDVPAGRLLFSLLHIATEPAKPPKPRKPQATPPPPPPADPPKPRRSLADEWASEPEWTGSDEEGLAWWKSKAKDINGSADSQPNH